MVKGINENQHVDDSEHNSVREKCVRRQVDDPINFDELISDLGLDYKNDFG